MARDADWTMRRDTRYGVSYVAPMFYDGQAFMVPQSLNVVSAYQLDNLRVCVLDEGDELANLQEFGFVNQAAYTEVLYEDREDLAVAYQQRPVRRRLGAGELAQRHPPRPARPDHAAHPARAHQQVGVRAGGARRATTSGSRSCSGRRSR